MVYFDVTYALGMPKLLCPGIKRLILRFQLCAFSTNKCTAIADIESLTKRASYLTRKAETQVCIQVQWCLRGCASTLDISPPANHLQFVICGVRSLHFPTHQYFWSEYIYLEDFSASMMIRNSAWIARSRCLRKVLLTRKLPRPSMQRRLWKIRSWREG